MKCPKCRLINPPNAIICDCGWNFETSMSTGNQQENLGRKIVLRLNKAPIIMLLLTLVVGIFVVGYPAHLIGQEALRLKYRFWIESEDGKKWVKIVAEQYFKLPSGSGSRSSGIIDSFNDFKKGIEVSRTLDANIRKIFEEEHKAQVWLYMYGLPGFCSIISAMILFYALRRRRFREDN